LQPAAEPAAVLVMAADHGVAREGVSAYPPEVTAQMVANFLRGGAAINVLARRQHASVIVVDIGVASGREPEQWSSPPAAPFRSGAELIRCPIAPGTASFLHGPAMTCEQAEQAINLGRQIVRNRLAPAGIKVLALGEMGIGNTTSASALACVLTGLPAAKVTGRGTGLDDAGLNRKIEVIDRAVRLHFPGGNREGDPVAALAAVGGFEIAGLVGACLEAAARRMTVVLDGFISTTAGLLACRIDPNVQGYCVAAHRSVEAGHAAVLAAMDLNPLLDLNMRLGEGTGAALALNLIGSAADVLRDMATFESAGVASISPRHG
jgi:nicotinate-nucleotide--dimethylbenzimidazole phosphoribosyltransferase